MLLEMSAEEIEYFLPPIHGSCLAVAGTIIGKKSVTGVRRIRLKLMLFMVFIKLFLEAGYVLRRRVLV